MNQPAHSSASFFEAKYQQAADPWNFAESDYELRRYEAILQALDGRSFASGLEPGCSVGVSTEGLAAYCDRLFAFDFSPTAADAAAWRCRREHHVRVACLGLEELVSFACFDLIVLSEIGYYFNEALWRRLVARITQEMSQGATLVAAHWTGESEDHEISGDVVHSVLSASRGLELQRSERHEGFQLGRWVKL